jgi:hypothetical protein
MFWQERHSMRNRFVRSLVLGLGLAAMPAAVWAQADPSPADLALDAIYTSEEDGFSLAYPADWQVEERSDGVYIANTASALALGFGSSFESGDVQIGVFVGTADDILPGIDVEPGSDAEGLLNTAVQAASEAGGITFGDVETAALDDRTIASTTFDYEAAEGYAVGVDLAPDTFAFVQLITAPGESEAWFAFTTAVIETITLDGDARAVGISPVPLDATYTRDEVGLTIAYPADWAVRDGEPNGIDVATSESALALYFNDRFGEDDVHIFIGTGTLDEIFTIDPEPGLTVEAVLEMAIEAEDSDAVRYSEVETLSIDGRPAALSRAYQPDSDATIAIIEYDQGFYLVTSLQTGAGQLDIWEPVLLAMLETVEIVREG